MRISICQDLLSILDFGGKGPIKGLALHGYLGESLDFLSFLDGQKHKDVHWYGLDLLGHGMSCAPDMLSMYTEEAYIHYLDAALDAISPNEKVVLLAYSFGVRIMLKYAVQRPERIENLIVISGTPGMKEEDERAKRKISDLQVIEKIKSYSVEDFMSYWYTIPLIQSQKNSPLFKEMYARRLKNTSKIGLIHSLDALGQGVASSNWEHLNEIKQPVLWIVGNDDPMYVKIAQRACSLLNNVELVGVDDSGHAPHLEQESKTLSIINDFIKELSPVLV